LRIVSFYFYGYIAAFRVHPKMGQGWFENYASFEIIFLFDLLLNFCVEVIDEQTYKPVRKFSFIASAYIKDGFALDFITLLPFQLMKLKNNR